MTRSNSSGSSRSPTITLQCGCEFNECSVLAMCVGHAVELATARKEREDRYRQTRAEMQASIDSLIKK